MNYFAMREYGMAPNDWQTKSCQTFGGRWVVRNAAFEIVDNDKYRDDLIGRYKGLVIIDRVNQ
jgi:hypothetical protein